MRIGSIRLIAGLVVLAAPAAWAERNIPAGEIDMPGEVVFKISAPEMASKTYQPALAITGRTGIATVDRALQSIGVTEIRAVFDLSRNPDGKRALGMDRIFHGFYSGADKPPQAAAKLTAAAGIEWAETNAITHVAFTPNDPTYINQWGLRNTSQAIAANGDTLGTSDADIDANQAWDVQTGSFSVVLAVLDTGIDRTHPEFAGRVQTGYDFVNEDNDPTDDNGHGTSCAGIAAAAGNNGQGIAGVAWGVRILPVKTQGATGGGVNTDLIEGITYAADFGANVLSMSVTTTSANALTTAVNYAWGLDCILVAAAGNLNTSTVGFPAACDHVIAVGALSPCNERKSPTSCDGENFWGSQYGTELDVMAPGTRIHTTDIRGGPGAPAGSTTGYAAGDYFSTFNGTSAATPFVAGIAALARSHVAWPNDQITSIIQQSCDDLNTPQWDSTTGWGRVNAYAVMRMVSGANFVGPNPFTETGSYRTPYRTIAAAMSVTQPGNWVVVKPGNYDEATPVTWTKVLHFDAIDGGVNIH